MDQTQGSNEANPAPDRPAGGGCLKRILARLLATAQLAAWHAYREASEQAAREREEMVEPLRRSMQKLEDDAREGRPIRAGEATRRLLGLPEGHHRQEKHDGQGRAGRGEN